MNLMTEVNTTSSRTRRPPTARVCITPLTMYPSSARIKSTMLREWSKKSTSRMQEETSTWPKKEDKWKWLKSRMKNPDTLVWSAEIWKTQSHSKLSTPLSSLSSPAQTEECFTRWIHSCKILFQLANCTRHLLSPIYGRPSWLTKWIRTKVVDRTTGMHTTQGMLRTPIASMCPK